MPQLRRFKWWVILALTSLIFLGSLIEAIILARQQSDNASASSNEQLSTGNIFSLAVGGCSIVLSLGGIFCSFFTQRRRSIVYKIEVCLIFILNTMWGCFACYSTLSPSHAIAVDYEFGIALPNIFFFSWFSVFASIFLIASWYQYDVQKDESSATIQWILLASSSFVVMISGIAFRDRDAQTVETYVGDGEQIQEGTSICEVEETIDCKRVGLAIILGAVSACISILIAFWRHFPRLCQAEVAFLLLIAWLCGVIFLTFNDIADEMGTCSMVGLILQLQVSSVVLLSHIVVYLHKTGDNYVRSSKATYTS
jgi:hypothetical protein